MRPAVVVVAGKCRGRVGYVRGADYVNRSSRTLVEFPGQSHPDDFRSISNANLRPATAGEVLLLEVGL